MINVPPKLNREDHNFFDFNPELAYLDPISRLLRSVGHELGSDIMWAAYLTEDPESSFFGLRDREERRRQIANNFLNNKDFEWDLYDYIFDDYPDFTMSKDKLRYKRLSDKFDKMMEELEGLDIKESIVFYAKLDAMYKGLISAQKQYESEKSQAVESRGSQQSGFFGQRSS